MWFLNYFAHIWITFFLILGIVRILLKNKRANRTEEICQKIPAEDERIKMRIRKITQISYFSGFVSILFAVSFLIRHFVYHHFDSGNFNTQCILLIVLAIILVGSPVRRDSRVHYLGSLMTWRNDIFEAYEAQNFKPISQWVDEYSINYYETVFYMVVLGRIIFYISAFGILIF